MYIQGSMFHCVFIAIYTYHGWYQVGLGFPISCFSGFIMHYVNIISTDLSLTYTVHAVGHTEWDSVFLNTLCCVELLIWIFRGKAGIDTCSAVIVRVKWKSVWLFLLRPMYLPNYSFNFFLLNAKLNDKL